MTGAAAALHNFQEKLGPAFEGTKQALDEFGKEKLGPAAEQTGTRVKEHPVQTAMIVTSGVTFVAPGIFSAPLLWVFGWGGMGVRAGVSLL